MSIRDKSSLYFYMILTYFTAMSNYANCAFRLENVTMMDNLEIIASCYLEFVNYVIRMIK